MSAEQIRLVLYATLSLLCTGALSTLVLVLVTWGSARSMEAQARAEQHANRTKHI